MKIDGWNIDLDKLHGPHKDKFNYTFDHYLYKNENGNIACLLYSVAEIAMGWEIGLMALYTNKSNPQLTMNPQNFLCFHTNDTVQFDKSGSLVFIKKYFTTKGNQRTINIPFCIIDISKGLFSYFKIPNSIPYSIKQQSEDKFVLIEKYRDNRFESYDGKSINLRSLKWYNVDKLNKFDDIYFKDL